MKIETGFTVKRLSFIPLSLCAATLTMGGCSEPLEQETERVGINTLRDPSLKSDQPCGPYPNYYLEYLDDTKCRKALPSDRDRDFMCPAESSAEFVLNAPGYAPFDPDPANKVSVDSSALSGIVSPDVAVTAILIRRVGGVPYYRYLSNGRHDEPRELWSSSKFLSILNASENLRYYSEGSIGLDASITPPNKEDGEESGKESGQETAQPIPLGDLVTVVHNYDEKIYTSNGLMYWFNDLGGRNFSNELVHDRWLNRPAAEEFGGNYGAKPAELGFTFTRGEDEVTVKPDLGWRPRNLLSTFTLAEALKRAVMYREDPASNLQFSTWEDMQVLLYGAERSAWYDEFTPQGMEGDTAVYLQSALDIHKLDQETQGRWRVFSKLGLGFSRGGELVNTGYACFPQLDESGAPIIDQGVELVISIHMPANKNLAKADQQLAQVYQRIVEAVRSGEIK